MSNKYISRLNIITKLLENHSLSFHETDYTNLLESLIKCLNSYKDTKSTKYLIMYVCSLLVISKPQYLFSNNFLFYINL